MIEGEPGRVLLGGFVVRPEHLNRGGKFHGGIGATLALVDIGSAIAAVDGDKFMDSKSTGPTVDMNLS